MKNKKWGIIGAMSSEVKILKQLMTDIKEHTIHKSIFWEGKLDGQSVVITVCGIGKVNAAACTQRMIDLFNVDYIVNSGIAGAMGKDMKIFDVVVSDILSYHDADLGIMEKYEPFTVQYPADKNLIECAKNSADSVLEQGKAYIGKIVSGDQFITSSVVKKDICERLNPLCVEMEGAAIGHVCYINAIPFVVIRTMSDSADDSGNMDYDAFEIKAAEISANIVVGMMKG